jgi:hypothetical protein
MGGWIKLHNEELHYLYPALSIIRMIKSRRMRWQGMYHEWRGGGEMNAYRIMVGNAEGRRPLRKARRRWEDNF